MNGSPRPEAVRRGQQRAPAGAGLRVRERLDGAERRAEARRPADAEQHAEQRRPGEAGVGQAVEAQLALHPGHQAEEGQAEQHGEGAEHAVDDLLVRDQGAAEAAEQGARGDEDRAEAEDEQHAAGQHPAASAHRRADEGVARCRSSGVAELGAGQPGHVRQVARHQREHARRQERHQPRGGGDRQREQHGPARDGVDEGVGHAHRRQASLTRAWTGPSSSVSTTPPMKRPAIAALAVEQDRARRDLRRQRPEPGEDDARLVEDRRVGDALAALEGAGGVGVVLEHDPDELDALRPVALGHRHEVVGLGPAGGAPRGPEVHDDDLPAQAGDVEGLAVERGAGDLRGLLAVGDREDAGRTDGDRLQARRPRPGDVDGVAARAPAEREHGDEGGPEEARCAGHPTIIRHRPARRLPLRRDVRYSTGRVTGRGRNRARVANHLPRRARPRGRQETPGAPAGRTRRAMSESTPVHARRRKVVAGVLVAARVLAAGMASAKDAVEDPPGPYSGAGNIAAPRRPPHRGRRRRCSGRRRAPRTRPRGRPSRTPPSTRCPCPTRLPPPPRTLRTSSQGGPTEHVRQNRTARTP